MHAGHVQSRCDSLNRFLEHVACSEVAGVGGDFGPFPGQTGDWARNEVRCPRAVLHISFKGHSY